MTDTDFTATISKIRDASQALSTALTDVGLAISVLANALADALVLVDEEIKVSSDMLHDQIREASPQPRPLDLPQDPL